MGECEQHTVLMVDDEANVLILGKHLLERAGFRVFTATNGEAGLLLAKLEHPQVILLDVMMPGLNGRKVLHQLKTDSELSTIPVIMVTARSSERDIAKSFAEGAKFHIEKPYDTKDLLRKIHAAITSHSSHEVIG